MTRYIQFTAKDGTALLVEVDEEEVAPKRGVVKAGLQDKVQDTLAVAQATFEDALDRVIRYNVTTFLQSIHNLPEPPNEVEMTFGLKATGELGNIAVCKLGGETNYTIKLAWKREVKES